MYVGFHVNRPLFLSDFDETWIIWTDFRGILEFHISLKYSYGPPQYPLRRHDTPWQIM